MGKAQIRESGSEAFTTAAAQVKDLKSKPSDTELLEVRDESRQMRDRRLTCNIALRPFQASAFRRCHRRGQAQRHVRRELPRGCNISDSRLTIGQFKGKAKFAEWEKQKGKTPEEADAEYVAKVATLVEKYGVN